MEGRPNYMIKLLTNLNCSCNVMRYTGYINECAQVYLRLCKKTNAFWRANVEVISCVILNDKNCKLCLKIINNFTNERADLLIKYKTYLLYNIDVSIVSLDGFKAMNKLMDVINKAAGGYKNKYPLSFFKRVNLRIGQKSIDEYNKFIKSYSEMGFNTELVVMRFDKFIENKSNKKSKTKTTVLELRDIVA